MTAFAERVSRFVTSASLDQLPGEDLVWIEQSFLDTVGTMLAGRTSPQGELLEQLVSGEAPGESTVVGSGLKRSVAAAALANGVFAHADDFDDMGGYGHPSAPIVAALLPAAESEASRGVPVTGGDLVIAYAVGFELGAALCTRAGYDQYERSFHSTPVFGALAATCAVARIMGLNEAQAATALGLAASGAAGLGRSSGTMAKPLHAGHAAQNSVYAALAARHGATAAPDVFEAKGGFCRAIFGHAAVPLEEIADGLGNPWRAGRTIFIKRFPCCGSNQSAASALEELMAKHAFEAEDVSRIVVHDMMETSPVLRFPVPETGCSAKFSIQHVLATLLVRGGLRIEDFRDEAIGDPKLRQVAARVEVEVANRWDMRGVAKHRGNPISVYMADGRVLEAAVPRTEMIGGPRSPLSEEALSDKFRRNAARSLSRARAEAALTEWRHISERGDIGTLMSVVA